MAETLKKSFDSPEETRNVDKGTVEILDMGGTQALDQSKPQPQGRTVAAPSVFGNRFRAKFAKRPRSPRRR